MDKTNLDITWSGSGYYYEGRLFGGLLVVKIDVYADDSRGTAYQIRIQGARTVKVATKVYLPDLGAAKRLAVEHLRGM